jgi:hypothetical protein
MLLNYPQQLWDPDTIMRTFIPYGRFLVWNKDLSNRARILVKFRAHNVDTLPLGLVVGKNLSDDGHVDTWTCPMILLSTTLLGGHAGDEDHLPPNGANPHPFVADDAPAAEHGNVVIQQWWQYNRAEQAEDATTPQPELADDITNPQPPPGSLVQLNSIPVEQGVNAADGSTPANNV